MRRDYAGADDLGAIQRFGQRIWSPDSRWHVGDLAWNLGQWPDGRPEWPMALWESDGRLIAWGWLALPDQLSMLVDPGHPNLVEEVLDWALVLTGVALSVTVLDSERTLVDGLHRSGYHADLSGRFFLAQGRDLRELPPEPELPPGFVVRPIAGEGDLARRAALHREVWHPSTLTDERYRAVAGRWPYRPDLDLVVQAPDGRFVAYCLGWYDEVNRVGELEPVGTVAELRRQGLSRAVSIGVLRAFREAGGERAIVYARGDDAYPIPKQVYAALGFTPYARTVRYRLPP